MFIQTTGAGAAFTCPPGIICRDEIIAGSDPVGGMNMDRGCTDGTQLAGDGVRRIHLDYLLVKRKLENH